MEELKKISPEEKQAFKKHYYQMYRAFEKLYARKFNAIGNPLSTIRSKKQF